MMKSAKSVVYTVALPIVLVLLWWAYSVIKPSFFVPSPVQVFEKFFLVWIGPRLWEDILPSLLRFAVGTTIAILAGILLGLLIGINRNVRSFLEPVLEFFRALPPPVLIPPLMLIFGATDGMKVVVIALAAVWPVLLNTAEGVRATDAVQNDTSHSYGVSGLNRLRFQVIPSASPQIFAGVRQALPIGLMLMIISEMFASSSGLGFAVIQFQRTFSIPEMWSGIVVLGLIGYLVAVGFGAFEARALRWYHKMKDVEDV